MNAEFATSFVLTGVTTTPQQDFLYQLLNTLLNITLRSDLELLLTKVDDAEQRVQILVREFNQQPELGILLRKVVSSARNKPDDELPLAGALRFYGQGATGFLIAYRLADLIQSKALLKDKTGALITPIPTLLTYAIKTRALFDEVPKYQDSAFAIGVLYDILALIFSAQEDATSRKKDAEILSLFHQTAIETFKIATRIARQKKKLALGDSLLPLVFIHQASKALMAHCVKEYSDQLKTWKKQQLPQSIQNRIELLEIGVSHNLFGAMMAWGYPHTQKIHLALVHFYEPFVLKSYALNDLYDLTSIAFLADFLRDNLSLLEGKEPSMDAEALRPELKGCGFKIPVKSLLNPESEEEEEEEEA